MHWYCSRAALLGTSEREHHHHHPPPATIIHHHHPPSTTIATIRASSARITQALIAAPWQQDHTSVNPQLCTVFEASLG